MERPRRTEPLHATGGREITDEEIEKQGRWAIDRALAILKEHFDSGVVLAAAPISEDRTMKLARYFGGIYTCIGLSVTFTQGQLDHLNSIGAGDGESCD